MLWGFIYVEICFFDDQGPPENIATFEFRALKHFSKEPKRNRSSEKK